MIPLNQTLKAIKEQSGAASAVGMDILCVLGQPSTEGELLDRLDTLAEEAMYEVIVSADGGTLWVNGGDGSCIGRFSKRFGIDLHNTATDQLAGLPQCLACTHGSAGSAEWALFRQQMREHHGVEIDDELLSF